MAWHRAPAGGWGSRSGGLRTFWKLAAPTLYDLLVFLALFGSRRPSEIGEGLSAGTGWEQSQRGRRTDEALQFGLVFMESALAPGVEWPCLAVAPVLACHRRPRLAVTGRHLAAFPGPGRAGAPCRLHTH